MKGFISKSLTVACLTGGLAVASGCCGYRDVVDPCYPERYNFAARTEVVEAISPQVHNGHILDQTMWNWMFEYDEDHHVGTDRLTPAGLEHLNYLVQRRPCPDTNIFLQTAHDVPYDPVAPEVFVETRSRLDAMRVAAVQKYLSAYTAGHNLGFNVLVHDPAEVGTDAVSVRNSILQMQGAALGVLTGGATAVASPPNVTQSSVNSTQNVTSTTNSGGTGR